jgi:hypothetical protein
MIEGSKRRKRKAELAEREKTKKAKQDEAVE